MSEKPSSRGRGSKPAPVQNDNAEKARQGKFTYKHECVAMLRRSKKQDNSMMQYYIVIGAFVAVCVAAVLYVLLNPKQSFA